MTATSVQATETRPAGRVARIASDARLPLFRNGYALVLSSGATSVLGMGFWLLATRRFGPEVVGVNAALVGAMTLLAVLAQLNLSHALQRYLPRAGRHSIRLIGSSYLVSAVLAVLAGSVFLLGIDIWAPTLGFLRDDPALAAWFVAAVALWCVFVLQDGALAGLRQAGWVPLENTAFGLAKLAVLLLPVVSLSRYGLFLAWTVPLIPLVLAVNALVYRVLVPRHVARTRLDAVPIDVAGVARFVAANYAATLVSTGAVSLLPIVVLEAAGAEAAGYFSLAWGIAYALYLVATGMSTSLLVEAAADRTRIGEYSFRIAKQTAQLLVPIVAGVIVFAPFLLRLFGSDYAAEATLLLRLLALASLPAIVTTVYAAVERARGRMVALVVVTLSINAVALTLSYVLIESHGITGIGVAWLATQSVAAAGLVATRLRPIWVGQLGSATLSRIVLVPRLVRAGVHRRRESISVSAVLPDVAAHLDLGAGLSIRRLLPTVGDVSVAAVAAGRASPTVVLKTARTTRGADALTREAAVLADLSSDQRLVGWNALLPPVLGFGHANGMPFLVEQLIPGVDGRALVRQPETRAQVVATATSAMAEFHERTAIEAKSDGAMIERWVDEPISVLDDYLSSDDGGNGRASLALLSDVLYDLVGCRTLEACSVHGDLAPGNLIFSPDGRHLRGIVDWERASPAGLADLDLTHLLLSVQMLVERRELGDVVSALLDGRDVAGVSTLMGDRPLVLLTWLHHVSGVLTKTARYSQRSLWAMRNIDPVLRSVASIGPRGLQSGRAVLQPSGGRFR